MVLLAPCTRRTTWYAIVPGRGYDFQDNMYVGVLKYHRGGWSPGGDVPGCRLRCGRHLRIFGDRRRRRGCPRLGNGGRLGGNLLCCRGSRARLCISRQELRTGDAGGVPCCNTSRGDAALLFSHLMNEDQATA